jgi:hypothetical protein
MSICVCVYAPPTPGFARPWVLPTPAPVLRFDTARDVIPGGASTEADSEQQGRAKVRLTIAVGSLGLNPLALRKLKVASTLRRRSEREAQGLLPPSEEEVGMQ